MAQETTIHRWDAQTAVGDAENIDVELAADGIDEYLGFVVNWLRFEPIAGSCGLALSLTPTDGPSPWHLAFASDRIDRTDERTTQATISGPVSDVYLWLLHRASTGLAGTEESRVIPRPYRMWDLIKFD